MTLAIVLRGRCLALTLAVVACAQPATQDLGVALNGIEKSRFLACSGPPIIEDAQGGQDRMAFETNLRRGQKIGLSGPSAYPDALCSVTAIFENSRLVRADFSGDMAMCLFVFNPCRPK